MWWIGLFGAVATAEIPLPSFRQELAREHYRAIDAILEQGCGYDPRVSAVGCADGVTDAAIQRARAFRKQVFDDAGVAYLQGLAHRFAGQDAAAATQWRRAVALEPDYQAAWYDLGELHLKAGRYAEAEAAFRRVAELVPDGEKAWLGPWRLAEVAAQQHDAEGFEAHIKQALERGFSFRQIVGLPNWKRFYDDPALRDTLDKLLTVYASPDVRESLRGHAGP